MVICKYSILLRIIYRVPCLSDIQVFKREVGSDVESINHVNEGAKNYTKTKSLLLRYMTFFKIVFNRQSLYHHLYSHCFHLVGFNRLWALELRKHPST